jgi:crossover junction endodeoxyribonuclease RuvC
MRVLGLDPGTHCTGYGVVERRGDRLQRLASGILRLGKGDLAARLARLHAGLQGLIDAWSPTACAVEDLFHHRSARSALALGHARGVCLLAAAARGLEVVEYPPAVVKKAVTGHGAAGKQQVAYMVARLLGVEEEPEDHASDALAAAICLVESRQELRVFE